MHPGLCDECLDASDEEEEEEDSDEESGYEIEVDEEMEVERAENREFEEEHLWRPLRYCSWRRRSDVFTRHPVSEG